MVRFIKDHPRMVLLKIVVAVGLLINHFYPGQLAGLITNLLWLFAF